MSFPFYEQFDSMDCGSVCLRMIAKYYGKSYNIQTLREKSYITREGVSLMGISDAAESIGMRTMGMRTTYGKLLKEKPVPFIAHWKQEHFIVVYKIKNKKVYIADPGIGLLKMDKETFLNGWISTKINGEDKGICLLLQPTPDFYETEDETINKTKISYLWSYLIPYKKLIFQLLIGLLIGSLFQLILPFLTQSIVDVGITNQNIGFIYLIMLAQLMLFFSRTIVEYTRAWILLHISTRINISLISDFLIKLMKLPLGYFDTKMMGDIKQRIDDHDRIEHFLTGQSLLLIFSFINLIVFAIVLALYSTKILLVFLIGSILYVLWILMFMNKRKHVDIRRFGLASENQGNLIQLIQGMQEIKLQNAEKQKRWEWEKIQAKVFKLNIKGLAISQYQQSGSVFIMGTINIFISIIAATSVINGNMTLGMMLAVQYIIGQLNSPIDQMIGFIQSFQDAKLSFERLGEIHNKEDEEKLDETKLTEIISDCTIELKDLMFQYEGPYSPKVLNNISLTIPENKVTAIVGMSGSGKTTIIKLLLGFYKPVSGEILIENKKLEVYNYKWWRQQCGAVMQDGYIFSDTIAKNIAVGDENIDKQRLLDASVLANIYDFISTLPLGYNTKIGADGHGLSQGQKQRILIARAIYKNPQYLFFDEATNALDAKSERVIVENLNDFYKGKTVVIVAHRLSTVKNADQIVVLDKGEIVEVGKHDELTAKKGVYYQLVKNQLELGN